MIPYQIFGRKILRSSQRELRTIEYGTEPGVFYIVHPGPCTVAGLPVSGPFPLDDPRFGDCPPCNN